MREHLIIAGEVMKVLIAYQNNPDTYDTDLSLRALAQNVAFHLKFISENKEQLDHYLGLFIADIKSHIEFQEISSEMKA